MKNKTINTLGLFSGGGGLDLGFSVAGFKLVASSDIDEYSTKTLKINQNKKPYYLAHPVICKDITGLSKKLILKAADVKNIDFVIGGPPCQAFSVFGKRRGLSDPRGSLVFDYSRLIEEIQPKGFLFENVAGLKSIHDGLLYEHLIEMLSFNGKYAISTHEYEVADFGVPQFRRRVFLLGSLNGHYIPEMCPTHAPPHSLFNKKRPYNTVEKAISNLPPIVTSWGEKPNLNIHVGRNHSDRIIKRYSSLKFGERDHKTRINKLNPKRPSFTIIVGSDKGGGKGHVHPYSHREVTPRESARLQSFPDWWEFYGNGRHAIRQVGNAVPPLFSALLASHIKKHVFGYKYKKSYETIIKRLDLNFL